MRLSKIQVEVGKNTQNIIVGNFMDNKLFIYKNGVRQTSFEKIKELDTFDNFDLTLKQKLQFSQKLTELRQKH